MSSAEIFYALKDGIYWAFENTLEAMGDLPWTGVLILGFVCFGYWMKRQADYNKIAENDPNQIK